MKIITKTAAQYHPRAAVVSLTDDCNLRCIYCFNDFKRRSSTFEVVDQTCKYLLKDLKEDAARPSLTFFGGEPLLKFKEIIVPIVEKYRGQIEFNITTNGVLLTEEVVDFLADNGIPVLLSIDGAPETQNRQRPCANGRESAKLVEKSIPYLLVRMPNTVFRSTLMPTGVSKLYTNFKYAEMLGFKHFTFIPNVEDDWSIVGPQELERQLQRIAREAAQSFSEEKVPKLILDNFQKGIELFDQVFTWDPTKEIPVERCGMCTTSMGVDVLGNFHACQENNSILTDEPLGNIYEGIFQDKHTNFLFRYQKDYKGFIEEMQKKFSSLIFARYLALSYCPKQLYSDNAYKGSQGWEYYIKSLYNATLPLYKLYRWSANPAAAYYLGIFDEDDIF